MTELYNGFTGLPIRDPDFESAGAASRRMRNAGAEDERSAQRGEGRSTNGQGAQREGVWNGDAQRASSRYGEGVSASAFTSSGAPARESAPSPISALQYARDLSVQTGAATSAAAAARDLDADALDALPEPDKRWAWVEVDKSAIRFNVNEVRRALKPRCQLMGVVKADAYGHGAVEAARVMLAAGATRLAVATVPEGVELRRAGIAAPVDILEQPPVTSIPLLLAHAITPAIYEPDFAIAYGEAADLHGIAAPYHLALNTGMNNVGVEYRYAAEFLAQVSFHRGLRLESTFTHYASADSPDTLGYQTQTARFVEAIEQIRLAGYDPGLVHAANSAAAMRFPEAHFDMVRCGIALYGVHPCAETWRRYDLRPALSVHACVIDTRMVPVSEGVSSGLRYRSPGNVRVCTLPLGFADGLQRRLSGRIDVIMDGRRFRQVGDICMDQCMFEVDYRDRANAGGFCPQIGDAVVVVGRQGSAQITVDELAEKAGATPYELLVGFGQRMPRVYV